MKSKLMMLVMLLAATAMMVSPGIAQPPPPCVPVPPPPVIEVGSSYCIQLCPGQFVTIELDGNRPGPDAVPIFIFEAGCQTAHCDVDCIPMDPPTDFILGGDPFFPDDYFGENDCLIIYYHWVHDAVWDIDIFSFCRGCFCLTYERQLAASLESFAAFPMDRQIELRWITASEQNNDRFDILRDGQKVGEVDATNSIAGGSYSWADEGLTNGTVYTYTLVSVSMTGAHDNLRTISASPNFGSATVVSSYALHQNFPNPFNPETSIAFDLVDGGNVKLSILNLLGQNVATLVNGSMSSGRHTVVFNGSNLTSGMYLYKLEANGFTATKKLVLLK